MKLAGFVVIGIIISIAFLLFCAYLLDTYIPKEVYNPKDDEGRTTWILVLLVLFPVSFTVGGFVTGFLSYPEIENKSRLIYMSPGNIYVIFGFVFTYYVSYFFTENQFLHILLFILLIIYQILLPIGGTVLGWFLKRKIMNWWYGD